MNHDLFRSRSELGSASKFDAFSLRSERAEVVVSRALVASFTVLVVAAALFPYSETIEARGQVVPEGGVIRIASDRSGVIQSYVSRENAPVERGQVVAVIRGDVHGPKSRSHARDTIENLELQIRSVDAKGAAETGLVRNQLAHLSEERTEAAARQARARANYALAQRKVHLAEESFLRAQLLAEGQLISKLELGRIEEQALNARLGLSAAEQAVADAVEATHELEQRANQARAQLISYEQQKQLEVNRIEQEILNSKYSESSEVVAPMGGTLTYANFKEGESVQQGDTLAFVVPSGSKLRAMAFVPSRFVAKLKVGDKVKVMVDSRPYQQYGILHGVLSDVSSAPVDPVKEVQPSVDSVSYRVMVDFESRVFDSRPVALALKPGELLSVAISSESKPVYRWIFDYLRNSVGNAVAPEVRP